MGIRTMMSQQSSGVIDLQQKYIRLVGVHRTGKTWNLLKVNYIEILYLYDSFAIVCYGDELMGVHRSYLKQKTADKNDFFLHLLSYVWMVRSKDFLVIIRFLLTVVSAIQPYAIFCIDKHFITCVVKFWIHYCDPSVCRHLWYSRKLAWTASKHPHWCTNSSTLYPGKGKVSK